MKDKQKIFNEGTQTGRTLCHAPNLSNFSSEAAPAPSKASADAIDYAALRAGTAHEERVQNDRPFCQVCGYIDDLNFNLHKWHGDTQSPRVPGVVNLNLSPEQLELLIEALNSHEYWQLSEEHYRNSGFVSDPGSDDPAAVEAITKVRVLVAMLEGFKE